MRLALCRFKAEMTRLGALLKIDISNNVTSDDA